MRGNLLGRGMDTSSSSSSHNRVTGTGRGQETVRGIVGAAAVVAVVGGNLGGDGWIVR